MISGNKLYCEYGGILLLRDRLWSLVLLHHAKETSTEQHQTKAQQEYRDCIAADFLLIGCGDRPGGIVGIGRRHSNGERLVRALLGHIAVAASILHFGSAGLGQVCIGRRSRTRELHEPADQQEHKANDGGDKRFGFHNEQPGL